MRAVRLGLAALAFGAVLSGCGGKSGALAPLNTTPAEAEAYIAKLAAESFKGKATAAADIASVRDALPKEISLTWGGLNFDAATGATVLTDVKLTPADMPDIGVGIAEVRLWDFDADFARARLSGQRLTETASLARRIEAKNIAVFGLETLMAPALQAYTDTITDAVDDQLPPEAAAGFAAGMDMTLDSYQFSVGRLVFDDVMLRPFELKLAQLPPGNEFAEAMPLLQTIAAVSRSFAADANAMFDFRAQVAMTQMGQPVSFEMTMGAYGARGMRGSDTDVAYMRDSTYSMSVPEPELQQTMQMSGKVDLMTIEGMRFDKLTGYLARGEWPAREAGLLSFGKMVTKGERIGLNGRDLYSVAESVIELRDFHWFIPTRLRMSATDVVYDIEALMAFVTEMGANVSVSVDSPAPGVPAPQPMQLVDPAIMQTLAKYGLTKPSMDYTLGWDWNPTSGATTIDGAFGLDNYLRLDAKFSGTLPSFKGVSDLIPGGFETADNEAISQLFANVSSLKMVDMNIVDEGGLDKGFALAVEIGKMMPVEPGQVDFFANQTPESLRQTAVAGVYLLAEQAANAAQLPALKGLLSPLGAFVEKGGKVRVSYKPAKPLDAGLLEQVEIGAIAPADLLKDVKVEHTPPAGGPVKPN